ncbi:hypothetical protein [Kutzneria sp. NPDC051319]|uniref:hypothetical protein n=1 Tax=Kutzneria sp. NPDC051319 TaxID=3155047 RepID=UPI0034246590
MGGVVAAGEYAENLVLDKAVTINAADGPGTVRITPPSGVAITVAGLCIASGDGPRVTS